MRKRELIKTAFTIKYDKWKETAAGCLPLAGGGREVWVGKGCLERVSGGCDV